MGASVGSIDLDLEINTKGFKRQISGVTTLAKKAGTVIAAAFATKKLVEFTKQCIDLGSNLAEVQNVVDVTFNTMANDVDKFAKRAIKAYGMSETVAKKYMGTYGAMSKSFGFNEAQAYKMSEAITALTGDVASFYNIQTDEAYTKLKSIWTGETESLKDLGVVMTQTALDSYALGKGYGKTTEKMSEAEKVALRYAFVQEKLNAASGDFTRTSGSWANQIRVLKLQFDSLKATLGQGFINLFTPVLQLVNKLIEKLSYLATGFKNLTEQLTGNNGGSTAALVADNTAESADNLSDAASQAKKLKSTLAGFDELNVLSFDNSNDTSDINSGIDDKSLENKINMLPDIDDTKLDIVKKKLSELKKGIDIYIKPIVVSAWDNVKKRFKQLKGDFNKWFIIKIKPELDSSFKIIIDNILKNAKVLHNNFLNIWKSLSKLGSPLKEWWNNEFTDLVVDSIRFITDVIIGLNNVFTLVFKDISENVLMPFAESFILYILPVITKFADEVIKTLSVLFDSIYRIFKKLYSEAVSPSLKLCMNIWSGCCKSLKDSWEKWGTTVFNDIRLAIKGLELSLTHFWDVICKPIFDNIANTVDWLWEKHLEPLVNNFLDLVGVFIDGWLKVYNECLLPFSEELTKVFGPAIAAVINTIIDVVGTAVAFIIDLVNNIITVLKGVVQFISGVFSGDLKTALKGVTNIFKGFIDGLVSIFKFGINLIIDFFNALIQGAGAIINGIVSAAQTIVPGGEDGSKPVLDNITKIPKLARGGIITQPTLAMVGERGREAVMPLENNTGWIDELALKLASILSEKGNENINGNKPLYIELVIGGTKFGRVCVDSINKLQRKTGKILLEV